MSGVSESYSPSIKSYDVVKVFKSHSQNAPITSLDFDQTGQYLISTGIDESIQLYDCIRGKHLNSIYSKKYGCHLGRFLPIDKNSIIYASTKENHIIRYLSMHDNSFIRYFKGHTDQVTSLEVSPMFDLFASCSMDNTVRLWDRRSNNCQGLINFAKSPNLIAFDPSCLIFAVYNCEFNEAKLFDLKTFDKGPFLTKRIDFHLIDKVNKIEFTNDGSKIALSCSNNKKDHLILNSATLELETSLRNTFQYDFPVRNWPSTGHTTITPDSKFVLGGLSNGSVNIWSLSNKYKSQNLSPIDSLYPQFQNEPGNTEKLLPRLCLFNPRVAMFVTADTELSMWVPN